MRNIRAVATLIVTVIFGTGLVILTKETKSTPMVRTIPNNSQEVAPSILPTPTPTPLPTLVVTSTPKPLSFTEMNQKYGPCVYLPTLLYHHIQNLDTAKTQGHQSLTVSPEFFRKQMEYVKDHGYTPIAPNMLINFFDSGAGLPKKPILLTFDDGYQDFATDAAPILKEFGFTAIAFIPTGLMNNPGYMNWDTLSSLSPTMYMANHTWSHHTVAASKDVIEKEITVADTQLSQHNLNALKVFAYPYGNANSFAIEQLKKLGYKLAYTTRPGSTLCKSQRFELPRTRIGNAQLSGYGL